MKKREIILLNVFFLISLSFFLGILFFYDMTCYEEGAELITQFYCNVSKEAGGGECVNCLCMKVETLAGRTCFYFANEHEFRSDLNNGDEIVVRWCPTRSGYRIRGVWKK